MININIYNSSKLTKWKLLFLNFFLLLLIILTLSLSVSASEHGKVKGKGDILLGLKLLHLSPDEKSTTSIGGEASVNADAVPELDIRYCLSYTMYYAHMYMYMYTYTYAHMYMYMYTYTYMYVYVYIYVYT